MIKWEFCVNLITNLLKMRILQKKLRKEAKKRELFKKKIIIIIKDLNNIGKKFNMKAWKKKNKVRKKLNLINKHNKNLDISNSQFRNY